MGCGCSGKYVDTEVFGSVTWMANRLPATTTECAKLHVDTLAYVRTQIMTADLPRSKWTAYPKSVEGASLRITPEAKAQLAFMAKNIIQAPSKRMHRACSLLMDAKTHRELARREQDSRRFVRRAAELKNKELEEKKYEKKVDEIARKKMVISAEKNVKHDADVIERTTKRNLMRYEKAAKSAAWLKDQSGHTKNKLKRDREKLASVAGRVAAAKARWEEAKVSAFEGKTVMQRREAAETKAKKAAKGKAPVNSEGLPTEIHMKAKEAARQMKAAQSDSVARAVKLAQAKKDLILEQAKEGAVRLKLDYVLEQQHKEAVGMNNTKAAQKMYAAVLKKAIGKAGNVRAEERKEKADRKRLTILRRPKRQCRRRVQRQTLLLRRQSRRKRNLCGSRSESWTGNRRKRERPSVLLLLRRMKSLEKRREKKRWK